MSWSGDRVADEAEIRDIVHRYADAASRRDPAGVAGVFTTDGAWLAEGMGVYHDEYRRTDGAWRIRRRRYDPLLMNTDGSVTALPFPMEIPVDRG